MRSSIVIMCGTLLAVILVLSLTGCVGPFNRICSFEERGCVE